MIASALYKLMVSSLVAGMLVGLMAYEAGATLKGSFLIGIIAALKDVAAYLSSPPFAIPIVLPTDKNPDDLHHP